MIVDDDADIRQLLTTIFELEDVEIVAVVEDGYDAVPAAFEGQPDVVILDLMMPEVDGAAAAWFLREVTPESWIIGYSGVTSEAPEWCDAFVTKGGGTELAQLVRGIVAEEDAAGQLSSLA
jgi:CheY-like chemotaxis protein